MTPSPCEKNYFLQNKAPASSGDTEPAQKNYFLQNKAPAVSGDTEPAQKKLLFCKTNCRRQPASAIGISLRLPEIYPIWAGGRRLLG